MATKLCPCHSRNQFGETIYGSNTVSLLFEEIVWSDHIMLNTVSLRKQFGATIDCVLIQCVSAASSAVFLLFKECSVKSCWSKCCVHYGSCSVSRKPNIWTLLTLCLV